MLSRGRHREPDSNSSEHSLGHLNKTKIGEIAKDSAEFLLDAIVKISAVFPPLQAAVQSLQLIVKRADVSFFFI